MAETKPKTQRTTEVKRFIGYIKGKEKGPTLIFFGGIHGNEMAGVKALESVFKTLQEPLKTKGSIIGIRGNIPAQLKGKRFLDNDLNRLWTTGNIDHIKAKEKSERSIEEQELMEIYHLIFELLSTQSPPFYFIDFHTTSSKTLPFITINDALLNRAFSRLFPVPVILGIEEYLEGPLLSHMNEKGYVSLGFESGQHIDSESVENNISFFWLTLVFAGALKKEELPEFEHHYRQLQNSAKHDENFYEVIYRRVIKTGDSFIMHNGFKSFEKVTRGTPLARHNEIEIKVKKDTILFMPLYQEQGEEGFFLIRYIPKWAMILSVFLRKIKFDSFLALLPGISWSDKKKESLSINIKVARFFTKPFFHLLGYRNIVQDKNRFLMKNRERTAKNEMYVNEWWFRP